MREAILLSLCYGSGNRGIEKLGVLPEMAGLGSGGPGKGTQAAWLHRHACDHQGLHPFSSAELSGQFTYPLLREAFLTSTYKIAPPLGHPVFSLSCFIFLQSIYC